MDFFFPVLWHCRLGVIWRCDNIPKENTSHSISKPCLIALPSPYRNSSAMTVLNSPQRFLWIKVHTKLQSFMREQYMFCSNNKEDCMFQEHSKALKRMCACLPYGEQSCWDLREEQFTLLTTPGPYWAEAPRNPISRRYANSAALLAISTL